MGMTETHKNHTQDSQDASPFPTGDHKATRSITVIVAFLFNCTPAARTSYLHDGFALRSIRIPSSNRSPFIFRLIRKMKHWVYKIRVLLNEAILCRDSASYFIQKWRVLLARKKLEKRHPHFKKSHLFYDINHNTEPLSINVFVCLKKFFATVI